MPFLTYKRLAATRSFELPIPGQRTSFVFQACKWDINRTFLKSVLGQAKGFLSPLQKDIFIQEELPEGNSCNLQDRHASQQRLHVQENEFNSPPHKKRTFI